MSKSQSTMLTDTSENISNQTLSFANMAYGVFTFTIKQVSQNVSVFHLGWLHHDGLPCSIEESEYHGVFVIPSVEQKDVLCKVEA